MVGVSLPSGVSLATKVSLIPAGTDLAATGVSLLGGVSVVTVANAATGALALLNGESNGLALLGTTTEVQLAIKDTTTPANNVNNADLNAAGSPVVNVTTSPKLVLQSDGTYKWSPHNLLTYSENLTAGWPVVQTSTSGTTVTALAGSSRHIVYQAITIPANLPVVFSVDFTPGTNNFMYLTLVVAGGVYVSIVADASTGTISQTATASASILAYGITAIGGGAYRVYVATALLTTSNAYAAIGIAPAASGNTFSSGDITWTAAGTETIHVTRMQLNRGTVPVAYMPTTSAAVFGVAEQWDASLGAYTVLSEPQATNLLTYSQAFDNAAWIKAGSGVAAPVVTANQATAPDGTLTADAIVFPAVSGSVNLSRVYQSAGSVAGSQTGSVWLRGASGGETIYIYYYNGTTTLGSSLITLTTQWTRYSIGGTNSGTSYFHIGYIGAVSGTGISGGTVYAWQSQLETGTVATSPIPTAAATVTRAADNDNQATTTLPWSATQGLVAIGATTPAGAGTWTAWSVDDGSTNNRYRVYRNSSNHIHAVVTTGGVDQADIDLGAVANSTYFTVAMSWAANSIKASLNAGAVTTDTSATLPTVTTMRQGTGFSGNGWAGALAKELYLPRVPANDAELQSIQSKVAA